MGRLSALTRTDGGIVVLPGGRVAGGEPACEP